MVEEVQWNLWKTRKFPAHDLNDGDTVYCVSAGGPAKGIVMYAARVHDVTLAPYRDHREAWQILTSAVPKGVQGRFGLRSERDFRGPDYDYLPNPGGGWLFAWWSEPLWWIGQPRPAGFRFFGNGYGRLDRAPKNWAPARKG